MGWTDVVSASPLSVGAFECVMRLPYLVQYIATVSLPVLAAACVVAIFLLVSTARAVHYRPSCGFAAAGWRAALVAWWRDRRAVGTTLFVLFLAYMPITSTSLRALDCTDAVDGVRYLRSNLAVVCYTGQHAVARVLAYVVLGVVGIGFPAGLGGLLCSRTPSPPSVAPLHARGGFLFDGYKTPGSAGGGVLSGHAPAHGKLGKALVPPVPVLAPVPVPVAAPDTQGRTRERRRSSIIDMAAAQRLTQQWQGAGHNRVWWEAVVLCRKAGVVLLAVMVTNPYLQCVGATLWFGGFLLLQIRYAPYTRLLFNRLELASLAASVLTAIISTALLQYNVGVTTAELHAPAAMTPIEWAVTLLLVAINMSTFLALAGFWLWLQSRRIHSVAHRVSLHIGRRTSRAGSIVAAWAGQGAGGSVALGTLPKALVDEDDGTATADGGGGGGGKLLFSANPLRAVSEPSEPGTPGASNKAVPTSSYPRPRRVLLPTHAVLGSSVPASTNALAQVATSTTEADTAVGRPGVVAVEVELAQMDAPTSVRSALAAIAAVDPSSTVEVAGPTAPATLPSAVPPRQPPAGGDAATPSGRVVMPAVTLRRGPMPRSTRPPTTGALP